MTNEELVKRYQDGDVFALSELTDNNIKLIKYIANRFTPRCSFIDKDDLIQQGWTGFFRAVQIYRADRPNAAKFSTYAVLWIRQAISRYLSQRVPEDETSLNEPVGEDGTSEKIDLLEDQDNEAFNELWHRLEVLDLRKELDELMNKHLTLRQRETLKLHFGWDMGAMDLREIGELYGISPQAVQQVHSKALNVLRRTEWFKLKKQEKIYVKKVSVRYKDPELSVLISEWKRQKSEALQNDNYDQGDNENG